MRGEAELREYAERMDEAERIAHFGVFRWEIETGRVLWSDELQRIYGLAPGEFAGTVDAFIAFLHPEDRDRVWGSVAAAISTLEPFVFQERIVRADGVERVLLSRGRALTDRDGTVVAVVGVCHDVTERVRAEVALGHSERRMRAILDHTPSIVAVKDLEGRFLLSNVETGRVFGLEPDEILGRHCAEVCPPAIAEQFRRADLHAAAEMEPVYDEAVLDREGEPRDYVTVTFALPDDQGRPVETCTIATDVTERKQSEAERRAGLEWKARIATAIREGRLLVYAQPVVDLTERGTNSYLELLVRERARDGEILPPAAFLPELERYGLIQVVDAWMVARALELSAYSRVAVNISAVTLGDADARAEILRLLKDAGPSAGRLTFEITETAEPGHLEHAVAFASELAAFGSALALDDFGVGFGSFTYLRNLPFSQLKIDSSFGRTLANSPDDQRVVRSIIGIAREFDLAVVAEGIEDGATLELVSGLGVAYAQGYHLGRPAPAPPVSGTEAAEGRT